MTYEQIIEYIDVCKSDFNSLELFVLTGGEPLTLKTNTILQSIQYAKQTKGMRTRLVTNGFWATSPKNALQVMTLLSHAGLDELNVSTGDCHLEFVTLSNVLNIARVQIEHHPFSQLCFVVEDHGKATKMNKSFFLEEVNKLLKAQNNIKNYGITIIASPWIGGRGLSPFRSTSSSQKNETQESTRQRMMVSKPNIGCRNIFSGLQISPTDQLLGCCGFAAEYSPLLKLGSFSKNKSNLRSYLNEASRSMLFTLLYLIGPKGIVETLTNRSIDPAIHDCEVCLFLLRNPFYLAKLLTINETLVNKILFSYYLSQNKP